MASSPENIFTFVGNVLDSAIGPFIDKTVPNVIAAITPIAITGVALYFAVMGYMVLSGAVQEPFWNFVKQGVKIVIVTACALNTANYKDYVVGSMQSLEGGLMAAAGQPPVVAESGETKKGGEAYRMLDRAMNQSLLLIGKCFEHAGVRGRSLDVGAALGWVVTGIFVIIGSLVLTLLAAANIFIAKIALVVFFALGPLFVMSLMWPVTAKFFDSWFASVLNYTFASVISAVILSFGLSAFSRFMELANFDDSTLSPIKAGVQILALGVILGYLLLQVSSMASSLAGGMGLSSAGIGWMTAPFRGAAAVARAATAKSARLDVASGKMVEKSALGHLAAGNTALNPRYRQALIAGIRGDIGRNWGRPDGGTAKEAKS